MGMLSTFMTNYMKAKYAKKNISWDFSDELVWNYGMKMLPILIFIPAMFWLLKFMFIDYMLAKKGFEITIIYLAIIMMIKPLIMDLMRTVMTIKKE